MSKQLNSNSNVGPFAPIAVGVLMGVVVVGTAVLLWKRDQEPRHYSVPAASETRAAPTTPPALAFPELSTTMTAAGRDPATLRVAARFVCACGSCVEERLDVCDCETAREERAFIQDQLNQGRSEAEAAEALNQKYINTQRVAQ